MLKLEFRIWLEGDDATEQAILGIVAGSDGVLGPQEREHLMMRSTNEFSHSIMHRLRSLGVITNIADNDPARYQDIIQAITNGVTVKDLIDKVKGPSFAPNGDIE
jgi:hypothetical protein